MTTIKLRRGVENDWSTTDPTLSQGEPSYETDTGRLKIGDGTTAYSALPYITRSSVRKTANYTILIPDAGVFVDAVGGAVTITLPTADAAFEQNYFIKKIDASANAVTVDGDGAETIDGATTQVITAQYDSITVYSDGTEWWIV